MDLHEMRKRALNRLPNQDSMELPLSDEERRYACALLAFAFAWAARSGACASYRLPACPPATLAAWAGGCPVPSTPFLIALYGGTCRQAICRRRLLPVGQQLCPITLQGYRFDDQRHGAGGDADG